MRLRLKKREYLKLVRFALSCIENYYFQNSRSPIEWAFLKLIYLFTIKK